MLKNLVHKYNKNNRVFATILLVVVFANSVMNLSFSEEKNQRLKPNLQVASNSINSVPQSEDTEEKSFFEYDDTKLEGKEYIEKNYDNIKYKTSKQERDKFLKSRLQEAGILGNKDYGLIYKSFVDGYEFKQNVDDFFIAASTVKIAYVMLYDEEYMDKEQLSDVFLTYEEKDYQFGGGYITKGIIEGKIHPGDKFSLQRLLYETIANSDNTTKGIITRNKTDIKKQILKYTNHKNVYDGESNVVKPIFMYDLLDKIFYDEKFAYTKSLMKQAQDYWMVSPSPNEFAKKYGWYDTTISEVGIVYDKRPYMIVIYKKNMPKYIDENKPTVLMDIGKIFYDLNNLP